jgi:hypothetical protein
MKPLRLLSLASFLLLTHNLIAQDNQNTERIEVSSDSPTYKNLKKGDLTFSLNGSASNSRHIAGWSFTPQAGYLVADRLAVGLQFSVANRFSKIGSGWMNLKRGGLREYALTPEVYARYYVLPFRFTPFVQLSSGYNIGKFSMADAFSGNKVGFSTNNFVMFGALGLSLKTRKNIGIQAQYNLPLSVDSQKNYMIRGNRFRLGLSIYIK